MCALQPRQHVLLHHPAPRRRRHLVAAGPPQLVQPRLRVLQRPATRSAAHHPARCRRGREQGVVHARQPNRAGEGRRRPGRASRARGRRHTSSVPGRAPGSPVLRRLLASYDATSPAASSSEPDGNGTSSGQPRPRSVIASGNGGRSWIVRSLLSWPPRLKDIGPTQRTRGSTPSSSRSKAAMSA